MQKETNQKTALLLAVVLSFPGCGWLMTQKKHDQELQTIADKLLDVTYRGCDNLRTRVNEILQDIDNRVASK